MQGNGSKPAHLNARQALSVTDLSAGPAIGEGSPVYSGVFFVRITSGTIADGWDCAKVGEDNVSTSTTWTRIRTKPGGASLTVGSDYPAVLDELNQRPIILG